VAFRSSSYVSSRTTSTVDDRKRAVSPSHAHPAAWSTWWPSAANGARFVRAAAAVARTTARCRHAQALATASALRSSAALARGQSNAPTQTATRATGRSDCGPYVE
jgi:hypothetical protein